MTRRKVRVGKPIRLIENFDDIEYTIYIGKNAYQNWLIFENARKNDWWFHFHDEKSGHVIISHESNEIVLTENMIKKCCCLVLEHSKFANTCNSRFMYSQIQNLTKGDVPGLLLVKDDSLVNITDFTGIWLYLNPPSY